MPEERNEELLDEELLSDERYDELPEERYDELPDDELPEERNTEVRADEFEERVAELDEEGRAEEP